MTNLKSVLAIVLMLSVILIAGCTTLESTNTSEPTDVAPTGEPTDVAPTGDVVAVVNGEEVTSEDVTEIQQSLSQQGQQVSEEDALEQVINQKVLEQKVQQEGITVTTQDAETVIEEQLATQGTTLDDYKQQLESQGLSYEEELESIKDQIATQEYLDSQLEGQSFNVTEEEAEEFYEDYKLQVENSSEEEVPSYEELESQIIATLEQQKQQEAINTLIQELRTDANVEYK